MSRAWPMLEAMENGREMGRFVATPAGLLRAVPDVLRRLSPRITLATLRDGETPHVVLPLVRRE